MLDKLDWYVENLALVFSCEFCRIFKNINHVRWLLLSVTRCETSKCTMAAKRNGLIVWWYSQWGSRFLPFTETCLEPSRKSTMKCFLQKQLTAKISLTIFAKRPIVGSDWVLNMPLYYLLTKVHRMSTKRIYVVFFLSKIQW